MIDEKTKTALKLFLDVEFPEKNKDYFGTFITNNVASSGNHREAIYKKIDEVENLIDFFDKLEEDELNTILNLKISGENEFLETPETFRIKIGFIKGVKINSIQDIINNL